MKVWANDTFCLYIGWFLVAIGAFFVWLSPISEESIYVALSGFAMIALGIATQLMAFQRQPTIKEE